jgi:hypothetical protein
MVVFLCHPDLRTNLREKIPNGTGCFFPSLIFFVSLRMTGKERGVACGEGRQPLSIIIPLPNI